MSGYYRAYTHRFNKPNAYDIDQVSEHANVMANAIAAPRDRSAQQSALEAAYNFALDAVQENHRTLTFCKSSWLFERMIHQPMTKLRALTRALSERHVRHPNTLAHGALFLGFELHILPLLFGKKSILMHYECLDMVTFAHWTTLIHARCDGEVLWPNYFELVTQEELQFDPHGYELDRLREWEELMFAPHNFLRRLKRNYLRSEICLDHIVQENLTPAQLRRRINHREYKKDILHSQKLREFREGDRRFDLDPSDASSQVIAVRTDSYSRRDKPTFSQQLYAGYRHRLRADEDELKQLMSEQLASTASV